MVGEAWGMCGEEFVPVGAKPEERIGSEEPVRRDAAVAAAATLCYEV